MRTIVVTILLLFSFSAIADGVRYLSLIEARISQVGIDEVMRDLTDAEREQYPIQRDVLHTTTGVVYIPGTKKKLYSHMLADDWAITSSRLSQLPIERIRQYVPEVMQRNAVNAACSNPLNKLYFKHGVSIMGVYSEIDGTQVFTTEVSSEDCDA